MLNQQLLVESSDAAEGAPGITPWAEVLTCLFVTHLLVRVDKLVRAGAVKKEQRKWQCPLCLRRWEQGLAGRARPPSGRGSAGWGGADVWGGGGEVLCRARWHQACVQTAPAGRPNALRPQARGCCCPDKGAAIVVDPRPPRYAGALTAADKGKKRKDGKGEEGEDGIMAMLARGMMGGMGGQQRQSAPAGWVLGRLLEFRCACFVGAGRRAPACYPEQPARHAGRPAGRKG
jgi:hypothetical protein